MKLAFVGAGGVGKGTLGSLLAKFLNIPFIQSHISETGQAMGITGSYKNTVSEKQAFAFQWTIMMGQIYQERSLNIAKVGYVAERSTLDYVAYFLRRGLDDGYYLKTAREWARNYTGLIFIEPEFTPTDTVVNSWKERDPEDQKETTRILRKEIVDHYPGVVLFVAGTPEERLRQITKALKFDGTFEGTAPIAPKAGLEWCDPRDAETSV
jgi:hypothetical protein